MPLYIPPNEDREYMQEFLLFKVYDPKKCTIFLNADDNTLQLYFKAKNNPIIYNYYENCEQQQRVQISERILNILNLSDDAQNSISKKTYEIYYKATNKLLKKWDPNLENNLEKPDAPFYFAEHNHLLNLIGVVNFLKDKISTMD
ncbi:MAG: hypothetical protein L0207_04960 [Chlamydiae bacterium]|nr:hypothetical protein [Chlamydiota bacterium]